MYCWMNCFQNKKNEKIVCTVIVIAVADAVKVLGPFIPEEQAVNSESDDVKEYVLYKFSFFNHLQWPP